MIFQELVHFALAVALSVSGGSATIPDVPPQALVTEVSSVSQEEIALIALVTMGEAEGESELGKRLVIDTILNRVDSDKFPNTIHEVVYQPHQFSVMWNDRLKRCYVRDDICQLVREELNSRTNEDVIFFTAGTYSRYGQPLFQVGNHYFSSKARKDGVCHA